MPKKNSPGCCHCEKCLTTCSDGTTKSIGSWTWSLADFPTAAFGVWANYAGYGYPGLPGYGWGWTYFSFPAYDPYSIYGHISSFNGDYTVYYTHNPLWNTCDFSYSAGKQVSNINITVGITNAGGSCPPAIPNPSGYYFATGNVAFTRDDWGIVWSFPGPDYNLNSALAYGLRQGFAVDSSGSEVIYTQRTSQGYLGACFDQVLPWKPLVTYACGAYTPMEAVYSVTLRP